MCPSSIKQDLRRKVERKDVVKKFVLVFLIGAMLLLSGCDLLSLIPGWDNGTGSGTTPGAITTAWIDFSFYGTVTQ